ncbi:MAG: chemotaxis protein CheW [Anaerolineae bacterium]|nr:chemotaxis protein CheW [Phycisphaerae bacterium]
MSSESTNSNRFVLEAREHLAVMSAALIALERGEDDPRARIDQLLRAAHSVKGGAGFTGRRKIEQLTHSMETALENVRDGRVAASAEVIDILLAALDRVSGMIDDLDHSDQADISEPLARLRPLVELPSDDSSTGASAIAVKPTPAAARTASAVSVVQPSEFPLSDRVRSGWHAGAASLYGVKFDWFECEREFGLSTLDVARRVEGTGTVLDSRVELVGPALEDGLPGAPFWYRAIVSSALEPDEFRAQLDIPCAAIIRLTNVPSGKPAARVPVEAKPKPVAAAGASAAGASLRISVPLIDRIMELAGELALVRNRALRSTDPANAVMRRLMRRLDSVTTDIQDAALRMRMQPVGNLFDRFPRLVRDLARQLGKQIEIQITGAEVELDKTVLEILADPLTHLVRNCCDHGIDLPENRARAGKPDAGLVTLSARQDRGQIVIEVRDDGKGLDPDAIKRKAIEQGIKGRSELEALSKRQLYDLILLAGFSTAAKVTDLSGRGVGMDVVKTNLDQIGGVVEIDSTFGQGTLFSLRLPLTLAIMPCLLLGSGQQRYAIPQRELEEIVLLEPDQRRLRIECTQDEEVLRLRGVLVPVVRLSEILAGREPITAKTRSAIIARFHSGQAPTARQYVAILRVGSHRFGLVVDEVLESEDIVVKPLHPLLRQVGVFGAATILGDGGIALILSGEGIARHSGILHRPVVAALLPPDAKDAGGELQQIMLFRYGPAELLAMPLSGVQRVVMIKPESIERVGERELVNVDGAAVSILRLDQILNISACADCARLFLIIPRNANASVGILASEIVDTPTLDLQLDEQAYRVDGVLGTSMVNGHIAVFLDIARLIEIARRAHGAAQPALPGAAARRILLVEDTQFFQKLITSLLTGDGFEVTLAGNGSEGLERLAAGQFDLVVSDIEMPVMDGFTFAQRVRDDARYSSLPMVAVTTLSSPENRAKALACGFDAFEVKLDRDTFLKTVRGLLTQGRSTAIVPGSARGGGPANE